MYRTAQDLLDELTGIRLSAVSTSEWHAASGIQAAARLALTDALRTYPVIYPQSFTRSITDVAYLPQDVKRIVRIGDYPHYRVTRLGHTTKAVIYDTYTSGVVVEVEVQRQQAVLPQTSSVEITFCEPRTPPVLLVPRTVELKDWPDPPFYAAMSCSVNYAGTGDYKLVHGVVEIDSVMHSALIKYYTVSGVLWADYDGMLDGIAEEPLTTVEPILPEGNYHPAMLQAEANLFRYLLADRGMYDRYTAIASKQAMSPEQLLLVIAQLEQQARVQARLALEMPAPVQAARLRRPIPK